MKKKQFMSKLAALTMAAAMGLTAVPATAVFAETKITSDSYVKVDSTGTEATLGADDIDVTAAKSAVNGKTANLGSATDATSAKSAVETAISANPTFSNSGTIAKTVTVTKFDAAVAAGGGAAAKDGTLEGTVVYTSTTTKTRNASDEKADLTITVLFTATWSVEDKTNVTLNAGTVSGKKITYTNGASTAAGTGDNGDVDTDNLTTLEANVKKAIEGADTSKGATDYTTAQTNIVNAVKAATHYDATMSAAPTSSDTDKTITGTIVVKVPQSDGTTRDYTISFSTDVGTAKQKTLKAATAAVQKELTDPDTTYAVDSDNTIDKVIAQVLADNNYTGIDVKSYTVTTDSTSTYAGTFKLAYPEVKNSNGVVTDAEVVGDDGNFSLAKGGATSNLKDVVALFQTKAQDIAIFDDTTADELQAYFNGGDFIINNDKSMHQLGVTASNVVINSLGDTAHGVDGNADITVTLTDRTGASNRASYKLTGVVKHSDSAKLKEAVDTTTAAAAKVDTSKAQKANAATALQLSTNTAVKVGDRVTYAVADAANTSVYGVAAGVVKSSLNTIVNDKATGAARRLQNDFGTDTYTKDSALTQTGSALAALKFAPVITVTKYTPATASAEGSADVEVEYRVPNDASVLDSSTGAAKTQTQTAKFTLTFSKLKAQATTSIELGGTIYQPLYKSANRYKTVVDESGEDVSVIDSDYLKYSEYQFDIDTVANGNDPINWTSSDPSVAIVDKTGKVTVQGIGTATITATDANDSSVSDTVAIVVRKNDEFKFDDVQDPNAYYFSAVYAGVDAKWVSGTSETTFTPNETVTRAQFVTWMYRKAGSPAVEKTSQFSDVASDKYYADAVAWGAKNGIVSGTSATTFAPNAPVTRAQAVTFMYRAYGKGTTDNGLATSNFSDVSAKAYYAEAVQWAVSNGVTYGTSSTTFSPEQTTTRGQGVTFLNRLIRFN